MALDVKPTRSELLKLKKQIKLAKSGHSLLKKKRDGLILEFFELMKKAKTARSELTAAYVGAEEHMNLARVMHTDFRLSSLAFAVTQQPQVDVETKNIMGVRVPKITGTKISKTLVERNLSMASSTPVIDQAMGSYETVVENVLRVAEVETAIKRLLKEIEKTKRRVNALEFSRIPAMEEVRKFIGLRLEEMDRENVFRLKRIKGKA
ncbi:V-type ATP synthase subunit D [Candidatus Woesearchaeota archaeon]|nr:V-type ATP synthase subunit D [Candidatus Woesearchaeota archaeon]